MLDRLFARPRLAHELDDHLYLRIVGCAHSCHCGPDVVLRALELYVGAEQGLIRAGSSLVRKADAPGIQRTERGHLPVVLTVRMSRDEDVFGNLARGRAHPFLKTSPRTATRRRLPSDTVSQGRLAQPLGLQHLFVTRR